MTIFNDLENTNQVLSKSGRLLGIDVGTKRIGIAVSDASRFIATPKLIIARQSNAKDFEKIKQLIEEYEVVGIVAGLPISMDGVEGEMTHFSREFTANLDEYLTGKFPIFFFDERLTSFEAREFGFSKISRQRANSRYRYIDDIAASLILQGFLDVSGSN